MSLDATAAAERVLINRTITALWSLMAAARRRYSSHHRFLPEAARGAFVAIESSFIAISRAPPERTPPGPARRVRGQFLATIKPIGVEMHAVVILYCRHQDRYSIKARAFVAARHSRPHSTPPRGDSECRRCLAQQRPSKQCSVWRGGGARQEGGGGGGPKKGSFVPLTDTLRLSDQKRARTNGCWVRGGSKS